MSSKKLSIWPSAPTTARGQTAKLGVHGNKIAYAAGRTVIIRDIDDPTKAISYAGHALPTTVARISPSGYYCASADVGGNVKIWDIVGDENILKAEYRVLGGRVNDLAWDVESKRIVAVGDGKDKFGHAFMMETGTSSGEISGHSKAINAVSLRPTRPYRAITASDDRTITLHTGVPFKYSKSISTHSNFVISLAYSNDGALFASGGADGKVFVYEGGEGEVKFELKEGGGGNAHKGSVSSVVWSPDNKSLLTSSGDCTVKLWDIESQKLTHTWTLGSGVHHQQVGNAWVDKSENSFISLSVSGDINVFDKRVGDKPVKILSGIQKAITCAILTPTGSILAGSADGRIVSFPSPYSPSSGSKTSQQIGQSTVLTSPTQTSYISALTSTPNSIYSIAYDDRLREISLSGDGYKISDGVPTTSQPKAVSASGDMVYIVLGGAIEVFKGGKKVESVSLPYEASAIGVSVAGVVAVGGQDSKIHIYDSTLKQEKGKLENNRATISAIAFSGDSKLLAVGDSSGKIVLYDPQELKMITSRYSSHTARINSLSFTPSNMHLLSSSLDTDIYIWSVKSPMKSIAIKNAVPGGANVALWLDVKDSEGGGVVGGAGDDGSVRLWEVKFHV